MAFFSWTEITSFHNIRKFTQTNPEILNGNSKVTYKSKIKLHGTNAAIQIYHSGKVVAQSRTSELSIENDNFGFAKWVDQNKSYWSKIEEDTDDEMIIYGEWVGKSIQQGVSVSEIPRKSFAVFAAKPIPHSVLESNQLIIEPYLLQELVKDIPDTYVLPWHNFALEIDWSQSVEQLSKSTDIINNLVEEVEKNDPWVENTFGIKGTGEGLVFYPTSKEHLGVSNFNNLVFKAKGEKHKNIKTSAPAQVNASVAANINQFVDLVITEARLVQAAQMAQIRNGSKLYDMKVIGNFLNWIAKDVEKECQDELEASSLQFKEISKALSDKARAWYIEQYKKY